MKRPLSKRQKSMLDYIKNFMDENSYPPTVRDIQAGCEISSTSVVDYNLQILQREALNGNVERCKEMIAELPEHQKGDIIHMLEKSVAEHGRTINLHE